MYINCIFTYCYLILSHVHYLVVFLLVLTSIWTPISTFLLQCCTRRCHSFFNNRHFHFTFSLLSHSYLLHLHTRTYGYTEGTTMKPLTQLSWRLWIWKPKMFRFRDFNGLAAFAHPGPKRVHTWRDSLPLTFGILQSIQSLLWIMTKPNVKQWCVHVDANNKVCWLVD